jgi:hypothetical protein
MIWKRTNPEPTPEQLAAWADGDLDRSDADHVESWLLAHPDAAREIESDQRLDRLFRDNPPSEPSEQAWQATLAGIDSGLCQTGSSGYARSDIQNPKSKIQNLPSWRLRLIVGLMTATAAAVIGGVLVARFFAPEPTPGEEEHQVVKQIEPIEKAPLPPDEEDEPFPVVALGEVNIISIDAEDADRVGMGQELIGTFDLATPEDIEIVKMEPHPEDGLMPRLRRGPEVPMIVAANMDNQEP